jgi:hypothetical protein
MRGTKGRLSVTYLLKLTVTRALYLSRCLEFIKFERDTNIKLSLFDTVKFRACWSLHRFNARRSAPPLHSKGQRFGNTGNFSDSSTSPCSSVCLLTQYLLQSCSRPCRNKPSLSRATGAPARNFDRQRSSRHVESPVAHAGTAARRSPRND